MNKQEALHLKTRITQEMPAVTVEILAKNHHKASETYTLRVLHTTKERMLQFNEVEAWEYIYCVWSV